VQLKYLIVRLMPLKILIAWQLWLLLLLLWPIWFWFHFSTAAPNWKASML